MTAKKVIRAQNIAIENRVPTIYLVDSRGHFSAAAGRRLSRPGRFWAGVPQQRGDVGDGHSADHGDHGHVRGRRRVSAGDVRPHSDDRGQRAVSGRSGAGAGGDWAESSAEELGGAQMHSAISGTVDFREAERRACLRRMRSLVEKMGYRRRRRRFIAGSAGAAALPGGRAVRDL